MPRDNHKRLNPLEKLLLVTETEPEDVERLTIDEVCKELQRMGIDTQGLITSIENMVHKVTEKQRTDQGAQVYGVLSKQDNSIFVDEHSSAARMKVIGVGGAGCNTVNNRTTAYDGTHTMAVMVPPMPFDFHGSLGEREVFEALSRLDSVYVFHSLRWVGRTPRSAPQGEADFVIFDPKRGLLVIEVKSGIVWCEERMWYQQNRATGDIVRIRDPEEQASRSKFELLNAISGELLEDESCLVCHAVWLPSTSIAKNQLPLNYSPEIIFDATDLNHPAAAVNGAFAYWAAKIRPTVLREGGAQRVIDLIAPTLSVVPSLRFEHEARERQLIRLTNEQARLIEFLDEQAQAVIAGAAGTGKTFLAVEKARRLARQGRQVLFVCYNAALKNWLRRNIDSHGVRIETFHSLAASCVGMGHETYDTLAARFLAYLADDDTRWDVDDVIIDEGQDFQHEWIEWLALRTQGHFYVFFDPHQMVQTDYLPQWLDQAECRLILKRNCRNTAPIGRTSRRFVGLSVERHEEAVAGPKPRLWDCRNAAGTVHTVTELVRQRVASGLKPEDIVMLTPSALSRSILGDVLSVAGYPVTSELTQGALCYTTIRKFKGLEATMVLLIDVRPADFVDPAFCRLLYVGGSRAKHELHILLSDGDDHALADAVTAMAQERKVPRNRQGFARLLDAQWAE